MNYYSITQEILSQLCGYSQMVLWCWGMIVIPYECIKIKSSRGLSKDFMLNNAIGFTFMAFQDMFGFFSQNASYASEVHISDILLSFCGCGFGYLGSVIVFLIPSEVPNNITWLSIVPNTIAIALYIGWWSFFGDQAAAILAGSNKAVLSLIAYIPQIILVIRNKTTMGWSMVGVWVDFGGGALAIFQIITDYYNTGRGTGFFNELNWGKFLLNVLSCGCSSVFFFQHYWIYKPKKEDKIAVVRKLSFESVQVDGLDMFEKEFVLSMSSNRYPINYRDADAVLRTPMGSQAGRFSIFGSHESFQFSDKLNDNKSGLMFQRSKRDGRNKNPRNIPQESGNMIKKVNKGQAFTTIKKQKP